MLPIHSPPSPPPRHRSRSRFLRRFISELTRSLLYLKYELGPAETVLRTGFGRIRRFRPSPQTRGGGLPRHIQAWWGSFCSFHKTWQEFTEPALPSTYSLLPARLPRLVLNITLVILGSKVGSVHASRNAWDVSGKKDWGRVQLIQSRQDYPLAILSTQAQLWIASVNFKEVEFQIIKKMLRILQAMNHKRPVAWCSILISCVLCETVGCFHCMCTVQHFVSREVILPYRHWTDAAWLASLSFVRKNAREWAQWSPRDFKLVSSCSDFLPLFL